jgi:hypothetical protein
MAIYIELGALLISLFLLYLFLHFLKDILIIIANSIFGFLIFVLLNTVFHFGIQINIWSIAIVALSGVVGIILVIILHFLGLAF